MRIQISTSVSQETRRQADELITTCGYSLRDVITVGIEMLYKLKIQETKVMNTKTIWQAGGLETPKIKEKEVIEMGWLFDLFVAHGVTTAEIAQMDVETVTQQIGELREPGVAEEMTDREIAEAILEYAQEN